MAKGDNIVLKQKGKVSCNKLPHYRSKVVKEKRWPNKGGYKNINCCSGAPGTDRKRNNLTM